jgi:hypothetical protein
LIGVVLITEALFIKTKLTLFPKEFLGTQDAIKITVEALIRFSAQQYQLLEISLY